ncbi:hypothetical protein [Methanococcus vannielii]|uniref:hypothetical protein n=1 Tax=Methanococcus vannielii TaxID=2187 RepID=UPI0003227F24|nr:hypothetical protein [Methanococcus vannielii]
MGAIIEYLLLRDETYQLNKEIINIINDERRSIFEKREIIGHLQNKICSKKQRAKHLKDKILTYYAFLGVVITVILLVVKYRGILSLYI